MAYKFIRYSLSPYLAKNRMSTELYRLLSTHFHNNINSNLYDCYMIQTIFMKNIFIHRIYIDIKFLKSYIENSGRDVDEIFI